MKRTLSATDGHYLALTDWVGGEFWTADHQSDDIVAEDLLWVQLSYFDELF